METEYMTLDLKKYMRRRRRRAAWRLYARLSLLALAAMMTARLVLLAVDVAQLQTSVVGLVTVPACAAVFIVTGWKLREWTITKKGGKTRE